jgi:hypothetical protein
MMRTGFPGYDSVLALAKVRRPAMTAGATSSLAAQRRFKRTGMAPYAEILIQHKAYDRFRYDGRRHPAWRARGLGPKTTGARSVMARCETCGNDYDKAFQVTKDGTTHTFDSFECAIQALARHVKIAAPASPATGSRRIAPSSAASIAPRCPASPACATAPAPRRDGIETSLARALTVVPAHSASKTRVKALMLGTHNHRASGILVPLSRGRREL